MSVRVFLDEINILIGGLSKISCLPQHVSTSNSLRILVVQKAVEEEIFSLCFYLLKLEFASSSAVRKFPGSQAFRLRLNCTSGLAGSLLCNFSTAVIAQINSF